ncbi:uncharacterized protein LOC133328397, partial [Musca vetustissima]|uniref:uncharacterized protein LOC133328397 n=1 Tax=Musca vetustissima TaxID=27455 RepID=UPI002AB75681
SSHVLQLAKQQIPAEVNASIGHLLPSSTTAHPQSVEPQPLTEEPNRRRQFEERERPNQKHFHHWHNGQRVHRVYPNENRRHYHRRHPPYHRWTPRRRPSRHHHRHHHDQQYFFGQWSPWSSCSPDCMKRRERHCKIKRKCGHTKHIEERKCRRCHPAEVDHHGKWSTSTSSSLPPHGVQRQQQQHTSNTAPTIVINAAAAAATAPVAATTTSVGSQTHQPTLSAAAGTPTELYSQHPVIQSEELVAEHVVSSTSGDGRHDYWGEADDDSEEVDFFVIKAKRKRPNRHRTPPPDVNYPDIPLQQQLNDYSEEQAEDALNELGSAQSPSEYLQSSTTNVKTIRHSGGSRTSSRRQRCNQPHHRHRGHHNNHHHRQGVKTFDDGSEGEVFQYDDFDIDLSHGDNQEQAGDMSYEEFGDYNEYRNMTGAAAQPIRERATPEHLIPKHRRIYSKWSRWTKCTPKCTTRRYKKCRVREQCGREVLREIAYCYTEGSFCQQWLQAQVQKIPAYELRPSATRRRDISDDGPISNSIVSDFIMNGKGYRGPEYTPMKLKCGIAPIRSNKRNMYNMLKIIGGKAARKGEWPWQVAIFNRFKEAFCGGTLIAPQWVLTAAHCVRKVLYVRLGEHNLDHEDGTELHLKVLKSYKHPNFDKKTVDSDVALLKLPKPVNTTTWIGFSCLPKPYQPLPKNIECTVIGWGKRRNRDVAGTSVLHQAEVPIISMDNCRSVYYDYTITKNMFCAGHKRGRIDTCAGDSGGPLLCRDNTKPNHPWTIFGITSFGDGCAKRNKFGIYAKVPNYVDWVWSVINCNGNCKMHQRL